METLSFFSTISENLGIPAMLLVFWLYTRVKDMGKDIETLKNQRISDSEKRAEELDRIYSKLNSMAEDVAWMRGRFEDTCKGKAREGT